jgi:hypothetical protein
MFSETNDHIYSVGRCIVWWTTQRWYPTVATINTNMPEAVTDSQCLSITLCYLATGNNFKDPKFITVTSQWTGSAVLDGQTVAERYCSVPFTVDATHCATPTRPQRYGPTVYRKPLSSTPQFTSSHINVFLFSQTVRKTALWHRVPSNRSTTAQFHQPQHSFANPLQLPTQNIPPSAAVPVASLPATLCTFQPLPLPSCSRPQFALHHGPTVCCSHNKVSLRLAVLSDFLQFFVFYKTVTTKRLAS